jgi:CubicO group peptidase (beta-lactamase class C family)
MHDVLAGYVQRGEVPGLIALVCRRGDVRIDVLGSKAAGGTEPLQRDSLFRLSSMTKPITAVAALILLEECKLRLDEPVDRLLPELAQRKVLKRLDGPLTDTVPAKRPISLRDLLTFRLGFGQLMAAVDAYPILKAAQEQHIGMGPPVPDEVPAPDEWIKRLGALPWMAQPGERWLYNTSSDVLSVLIARASGQPFETFLRERLFEPLGMKDTSFGVPAEKLGRLTTSYSVDPKTGGLKLYDAPSGGMWSHPPKFAAGSAGLCSTIDDYLAFTRMLLNRGVQGNVRILSRPTIETMTTDQLMPQQKDLSGIWVPSQFESHGWGFGVAIATRREDPWESVGAYGWDGGMGTVWRNDPSEEMITILLSQRMWTSPAPPQLARDFWASAYAAIDD